MDELRELYQEVILDHGKNPRNHHALADATHDAVGHNAMCGDSLHLYLIYQDGRVLDASFKGQGCAISLASASLMTEILKGKTKADIDLLHQAFHLLATGDETPIPARRRGFELQAYSRRTRLPMRVKARHWPGTPRGSLERAGRRAANERSACQTRCLKTVDAARLYVGSGLAGGNYR